MSESLKSIFLNSGGPAGLIIKNKTFSNEQIKVEFIDCCEFVKVNFLNCFFDECEFLGAGFSDCDFTNCQFIESKLTPKAHFFQTSFSNCLFLMVNLRDSL